MEAERVDVRTALVSFVDSRRTERQTAGAWYGLEWTDWLRMAGLTVWPTVPFVWSIFVNALIHAGIDISFIGL